MKTIEIKKLIKIQLLILIIVVSCGFVLNQITFRYFKKLFINHNEVIASAILEKHPELEEELIDAILNSKTSTKNYLGKYDLDNTTAIEQLSLVKNVNKKMLYLQLSYCLLAFILLSVPYIFYIRRQKKQVNDLNNDMNLVLNKDFQLQISDFDELELSTLKNNLQKMIGMLKDYSENMRLDKIELEKTLSDISHQIKTPLTSMYVINDLLMDSNISKDKQKDLLIKNKKQLERIEWLVTSLLKISRLDSGVIVLKKQNVSAKKLIDNVVDPLSIPMEVKKQNLILDVDDININCDMLWTTEALVNILKNAHEHTNEGGTIKIKVSDNPIYTVIVIKDNGVGIAKKDLPHIFKRFYKASNNSSSIGIGLNMAYTIVTKQDGDITVISNSEEGTTFTVKFYKNRD